MTTAEIQKNLSNAGKKVGLTQLYKYFSVCGIKPQGARQRPAQYPDDSAEQILSYLGFAVPTTPQNGKSAAAVPNALKNRVAKRNGNAVAKLQGRAVVARLPHKQKAVGSIPTPATIISLAKLKSERKAK